MAAVGLVNPLLAAFIHLASVVAFILKSTCLLTSIEKRRISNSENDAKSVNLDARADQAGRYLQDPHLLSISAGPAENSTAHAQQIAILLSQARAVFLTTQGGYDRNQAWTLSAREATQQNEHRIRTRIPESLEFFSVPRLKRSGDRL
jgi:hypothetical protein